jgi:uncharacterized membrane protein YhaH (DUF805 family)
MFSSPFSFEGRIRRTEYGISMIIYAVLYFVQLAIMQAGAGAAIVALLLFIPMLGLYGRKAQSVVTILEEVDGGS